jgi:hypothetical protein
MIRLLTGGGLGDAAMSYAKIHSQSCPFSPSDPFTITHHSSLRKSEGGISAAIKEFYSSQGIRSSVVLTDMSGAKFYEDNIDDYHHYLGTSWTENNGGGIVSWPINAFPPFKCNKIAGPMTLIALVSGSTMARSVDLGEVKKLAEYCSRAGPVGYIGWAPVEIREQVESELPGTSYLNGTTIPELLNLLCSSETVIGPQGFITHVACMMRKQVLAITPDRSVVEHYIHPSWNVTITSAFASPLTSE